MRIIRKGDRFSLAVFLMDYHSGQWSRGYRLLCKLKVSGNWSAEFMEELRDTEIYQYLVTSYANHV